MKSVKKEWVAPAVESLPIKNKTLTGMRRGRSRNSLKSGRMNKPDDLFESS